MILDFMKDWVLAQQTMTFFIIGVLLLIALLLFWFWALIDMLTNRKLKNVEKGIWFILFFITTIFTAIIWVVVRGKRRSKR